MAQMAATDAESVMSVWPWRAELQLEAGCAVTLQQKLTIHSIGTMRARQGFPVSPHVIQPFGSA